MASTRIYEAASPDLRSPDFAKVRSVRIILAYNKDEDQTGLQLFANLTNALGTRVGDAVSLSFERWNLTTIVEAVKQKLLSPSLSPPAFYSLLSYMCAQIADFRHGSEEWTKQLVPNWRRFLQDALNDNTDERSVRLIPVVSIILREHGKSNPSIETGWIDLIEWAMLAIWKNTQPADRTRLRVLAFEIWVGFYLAELERFYDYSFGDRHEHSLNVGRSASTLDAVADAVLAFWHSGRLGLLGLGCAEILLDGSTKEECDEHSKHFQKIANSLVSLINANPGTKASTARYPPYRDIW